MTSKAQIDDFLAQKRFAFVGVSRRRNDFSRELFRAFAKKGWEPVPVHPQAGEIEGVRCFPHIADVYPPVDSVLLMTSPSVTDTVAEECVAAGVKRVWFYGGAASGALNVQAVGRCAGQGMSVIAGECPLMFLPGTGIVHRVHGLVKKIRGTYPSQ